MTTANPPADAAGTPLDDRRRLEEVRDVLARKIEAGPGAADLAALSREYRQVLAALRELPASTGSSAFDQLAAARAAREAAAKGA